MNIFEKHILNDPQFPFIFHDQHFSIYGATRNNWHENIEILCFVQGSATIVNNGQSFFLKAGDIAIIDKNALHCIRAATEVRCYCLIIDHSFCTENYFDVDHLHFSPLVQDEELFELINRFAEVYACQNNPHHFLELRTLLLTISLLLCQRHSVVSDVPHEEAKLFSAVKQVVEHIHAECHHVMTLDDLAKVAGINRDYLSRSFHKITGYTITAYINLSRCERAKHLLKKKDLKIEHVAHECGFENVSYFYRTFLSVTGLRPGEYRAKHFPGAAHDH